MKKTILIFIFTCAALLCANYIRETHCMRAYANFEPEYVGFITGCMITVDEQRVPSSNFRMTL